MESLAFSERWTADIVVIWWLTLLFTGFPRHYTEGAKFLKKGLDTYIEEEGINFIPARGEFAECHIR
jgi:hypothetical protein